MNNNNNIDKNLLQEIIQAANLPAEKVKKEIPNLDKVSKGDRIEPIKTATDQDKIDAYDKLQVQDLPADWKLQLARLKHLESELSNYTQIKTELKGWTDTFTDKNPLEVQNEIKQLEEKQVKTETELNNQIKDLEANLSTLNQEKTQISQNLEAQVLELQTEIKDWKDFFNHRELSEIKTEWEDLKQRPDISISEKEFYDDYARRKSIKQNKLEAQAIADLKAQITELKKEKQNFQGKLAQILENARHRRFILADPVITKDQAREAMEELLIKTAREWEEYFQSGQGAEELALNLSFEPHKRTQAEKILEWIKETQTTHDYQKLFERWSGGSEYNKEFDLDGSLLLLGKRLEKFSEKEK